jgi:hypothetical protein
VKQIPGTCYKATQEGQIIGPKGHLLKPRLHQGRSRQYHKVCLVINGKKKEMRVHRLVLLAFIGAAEAMQGCHLNGNSLDNRLENLAWGDQKTNESHKPKHCKDCGCMEKWHDESGQCHTEGCLCKGWA